jgi:protoporphyrinogen IX oxidase
MMVLWIKALHIIAVIAWMAGLFYLPRLYVYHTKQIVGSDTDELFKVMERRLLKAIMRPACVVALLAGGYLVSVSGFAWSDHWLLLKLVGVLALLIYHGMLESYCGKFAGGWRGRTERYFRVLNEVPTVLLIWIVIFVVVKPFS